MDMKLEDLEILKNGIAHILYFKELETPSPIWKPFTSFTKAGQVITFEV